VNALLQGIGEEQAAGFFLVLGRIGPLFVLAPMLSARMVPARVRTIVAVGIAVGLTPIAMRGADVPVDGIALGELMVKEILVGFAFAFAVGVVFAAVSTAGSFLDTIIGFGYGHVVDPITGTQAPVLSQIYALLGVLIFITIGGDAWMIQGIGRTYDLVPLLDFPSLGALTAGTQQAFAGIFVSAIELAAPILLALIITDAAFGMVSRVVPQMNVFAVGFPAKIVVGLVIMVATLPFAGGWIADQVQNSVADALKSLRVAAP
jgi:flagellar biosynthesis protein FliR